MSALFLWRENMLGRILLCKQQWVKVFSSGVCKNNCFKKPWPIHCKPNIPKLHEYRQRSYVLSLSNPSVSTWIQSRKLFYPSEKAPEGFCPPGRWFSVWASGQQHESPGKVLEMLILGPHLTPTESDTLGVGLSCLYFNKPSREFCWIFKCENTAQENSYLLDVLDSKFFFWGFCSWILSLSHIDHLWIKREEL
jgi:hypothetical protein